MNGGYAPNPASPHCYPVRWRTASDRWSGELEFDSGAERLVLAWTVADAIRQPVVDWAARISNPSDELLKGEIERAARRRILDLVPEK